MKLISRALTFGDWPQFQQIVLRRVWPAVDPHAMSVVVLPAPDRQVHIDAFLIVR